MKNKALVVINDLHSGSKYGPIPPRWRQSDRSLAPGTEANHWIYEKFESSAEEFKKPDILVCNGDITDGHQHINYGREVWATDAIDQIKLGEYLISLYQPKELYIVYGSPYHVQYQGLQVERFIARSLKAKGAGWRLRRELGGTTCSIAHHITVSSTSWQYRLTPLGIQMVLDRLQNEDKSANLICRAHAHYYGFCGFAHQLAIIVPGYQGQTPYGAMKQPEVRPKIGMVAIELPSLDFTSRTCDGPILEMEEP